MQASDWNAVKFGNDCMINGFLQFHTFENMMLKVKLAEISDGCTVNFGATVMGGAVVEPGATLLPLSLVLKEMHLPTAVYEGSPAGPIDEIQYSAGYITQVQALSGLPDLVEKAAIRKGTQSATLRDWDD